MFPLLRPVYIRRTIMPLYSMSTIVNQSISNLLSLQYSIGSLHRQEFYNRLFWTTAFNPRKELGQENHHERCYQPIVNKPPPLRKIANRGFIVFKSWESKSENGVLLFSKFSPRFARGFILFRKCVAGFYFCEICALFLLRFCPVKSKKCPKYLKNFRRASRGVLLFSKFSRASRGVLFFSKFDFRKLDPGFYCFQNSSQKSPAGFWRRGGVLFTIGW